jgi:DNA helicase-2/ATP-dependent DNA helicase PcrA
MPIDKKAAKEKLLNQLREQQKEAVKSKARRLLVIAGAGSGKTDVMARRVAWWVAVDGVSKDNIVAFTFTDAAAEELKFRIRKYMQEVARPGEDSTLGDMYIGTIHGFCLKALRDYAPTQYYNYDITDESTRIALVQRGFSGVLGLSAYQMALGTAGRFDSLGSFLKAYDLLNEYDLLEVNLPDEPAPTDVREERHWIEKAKIAVNLGNTALAKAFVTSAARLYAYMRARRFLDFSTSQSELTRLLRMDKQVLHKLRITKTHIVLDEAQDINPVQLELVKALVGNSGHVTAVGDHRQAIYSFRGGRVDLMASLFNQFKKANDGDVIELHENFRSTSRIIKLANSWANTIGTVGGMPTPPMAHGNTGRNDHDASHVALLHFDDRLTEAEWIARTIKRMLKDGNPVKGARHDTHEGERGIAFSDIAILVRSATDVRIFQNALDAQGVPAIVRAGPDLYSQPEVLLFLALMAGSSGMDQFLGAPNNPKSLPSRVQTILGCDPNPSAVVVAACAALRAKGLPIAKDSAKRLQTLAFAISKKIQSPDAVSINEPSLHSKDARQWLRGKSKPRRVFPQTIFHWFLEEADVAKWDAVVAGRAHMFHLGQLSKLIKGMETPGWTSISEYKYQVIALLIWGTQSARTEEAPLLVAPDAVVISTIHGAKGLEFPVVFLADVTAGRFPSNKAKQVPSLPFSGPILQKIDASRLADNNNYDGERRLMYVALTRAERYLFITHSGDRTSRFIKELPRHVQDVGGFVGEGSNAIPSNIELRDSSFRRDHRLTTSFSDLRYYLECPHDFYLRKVIGFTPTIDQAFGYGRGIHNILREINDNPKKWACLAKDTVSLDRELDKLVKSGLFYMRYTTAEPLENLRAAAKRGLVDYVKYYASELATLQFEPERTFETMLDDNKVLINGSIDLVRHDDPPHVTIVDFKSGAQDNENQSGLSNEMMKLQIGVYGLAAKKELEYEPDQGLIRYIGETDPAKKQTEVILTETQLDEHRKTVVEASRQIRGRKFSDGPTLLSPQRCKSCDFLKFCGHSDAEKARRSK